MLANISAAEVSCHHYYTREGAMCDGGDGGDGGGLDSVAPGPEIESGLLIETADAPPVVLGPGFSGHAVLPSTPRPTESTLVNKAAGPPSRPQH
jgi:hypothetical protein